MDSSQISSGSTQTLPNLVIVGAMKCGTTSLHHYLNLHPQICMSSLKELDFFVNEKNWKCGTNWYQSQFPQSANILGESSPNYTKYPTFSGVPERMQQLIPQAKLIYLVRHPVQRLISHYLHQYINRAEYRSLNEALSDLSHNHYLAASRYAFQLEQFLPYYSLDRILVLSLEALSVDRISLLQRIFRFLEVDSNFNHPGFTQILHQSSHKQRLTNLGSLLFRLPAGGRLLQFMPQLMAQEVKPSSLDSALEQRLIEVLHPDVERLRALTGATFSEWNL